VDRLRTAVDAFVNTTRGNMPGLKGSSDGIFTGIMTVSWVLKLAR